MTIAPFITSLLTRFAPAPTSEQATHRFSTGEILRAVKAIDPASDLTIELIHDQMLDLWGLGQFFPDHHQK